MACRETKDIISGSSSHGGLSLLVNAGDSMDFDTFYVVTNNIANSAGIRLVEHKDSTGCVTFLDYQGCKILRKPSHSLHEA